MNTTKKDELQKVQILPNEALEKARQVREAKLATLEAWRIAREIVVPVDDDEVRADLRRRGRPICYFGEDAHDRRDRLRALMVADVLDNRQHDGNSSEQQHARSPSVASGHVVDRHLHGEAHLSKEKQEDKPEDFYTEGDPQLRALRVELALPSLKRAAERLSRERLQTCQSDEGRQFRTRVRDLEAKVVKSVRESYTVASNHADDRPLSAISLAVATERGDAVVATASWGGCVKIWGVRNASEKLMQSVDLHTARVSNVCFPRGREDVLLTCSSDGTACLVRRADDGVFMRRGRMDVHDGFRVCDVKMHPFRHSLLATAGYDGLFVLHDDGRVMLRQATGHDRVYRMSFHPDGSLLATCGLDGGIRLWDLRSGHAVITMTKAHADDVLGVEFGGDGRILASCGMDNVFRIWDVRKYCGCEKTVAAHRGLISDMRFGGGLGQSDVLFTGSFDRTVKCWGARRNWGLLAVHSSYEDKVTSLDCSADGRQVVTACYDKTWKVWGRDDN